jgi:hypothetical protein
MRLKGYAGSRIADAVASLTEDDNGRAGVKHLRQTAPWG